MIKKRGHGSIDEDIDRDTYIHRDPNARQAFRDINRDPEQWSGIFKQDWDSETDVINRLRKMATL